MNDSAGRTPAHHEILSILEKGGMGPVGRERDATLGPETVIRTLPEAFAKDTDR